MEAVWFIPSGLLFTCDSDWQSLVVIYGQKFGLSLGMASLSKIDIG